MKACYRGISYEPEIPTIEAIETQRTGLFLGKYFKIKQYSVSQYHSTSIQLKYRGINHIP